MRVVSGLISFFYTLFLLFFNVHLALIFIDLLQSNVTV